MFIIASFLLSLNACGYKTAPYYENNVLEHDSNIEFILEKENDNNESCQ